MKEEQKLCLTCEHSVLTLFKMEDRTLRVQIHSHDFEDCSMFYLTPEQAAQLKSLL